jgi:small subunit ribosomal protein S3Ae
MARRVKVKEKWKGKEWYQIVAPKGFKNVVIGETPAMDQDMIKDRVIEASLVELANDPSKYYTKLFFKVVDFDGNKALTAFHGHSTTKDFIARIVQIRSTRIDTNNIFNMKDGKMRVKAILVTNRKVKKPLAAKIRKQAIDLIREILSDMTIEQFMTEITTGKMQGSIKAKVKKLYPVRFFEFRRSHVIA